MAALAFLALLGSEHLAAAQGLADTRDDVEITVFTGISIDSFAAQALKDYIDKEDSSTVRLNGS